MEQPSWAVERARAALNIGMKAPEVEQVLIAKGLSPSEANDVVMSILAGRVRAGLAPVESEARLLPAHRIASVLVAVIFLALVYWFGGGRPTAWTLVCILPGLAGIWLPEMMAWEWDIASRRCRAAGWVWLLLFGIGRVLLVAIWSADMPELQWLDGYNGQTVDELIALEGKYRTDSLVLAFEQAIDQKSCPRRRRETL